MKEEGDRVILNQESYRFSMSLNTSALFYSTVNTTLEASGETVPSAVLARAVS